MLKKAKKKMKKLYRKVKKSVRKLQNKVFPPQKADPPKAKAPQKDNGLKPLGPKDDASVKAVMARTGWTYDFTRAMITEAQVRTHCTFKEFLIYKFYELEKEEQEEVFVAHESLQIRDKYDVDKDFANTLLDKERTNLLFSDYLKRAWCVNTKVTLEEFREIFQGTTRIMYKPIHGNRGKGIQDYYLTEENMESVYHELKALPEAVLEEYVVQHPSMNHLSSTSVNTLRIVTVSSNTRPVTPDGKYLDVAYAALRMGGGTSIVDNFHSGGMVAAVDLETGALVTDATNTNNDVFVTHPETGCTIKGFVIPHFQEALDMVVDACKTKKLQGYIGWDVAITESGPVLIEVNVRPGVVLISMPWTTQRKGMRSKMIKYLEA